MRADTAVFTDAEADMRALPREVDKRWIVELLRVLSVQVHRHEHHVAAFHEYALIFHVSDDPSRQVWHAVAANQLFDGIEDGFDEKRV